MIPWVYEIQENFEQNKWNSIRDSKDPPYPKGIYFPVNLSGVNRFAWRCDKQLTADLTALLASVFTKLWVLFSYSKKWLLHFLYLSKVRWLTKASLIRLIKNFLAKNKKVSLVIIEARYLFDNRYKFYLLLYL